MHRLFMRESISSESRRNRGVVNVLLCQTPLLATVVAEHPGDRSGRLRREARGVPEPGR